MWRRRRAGGWQETFPLSQSGPRRSCPDPQSPSVDGISVGSPLFFCKMVVGSVTGVTLARDGSEVLIDDGMGWTVRPSDTRQ